MMTEAERKFREIVPAREPYPLTAEWWEFRARGLEAQRRMDEVAKATREKEDR